MADLLSRQSSLNSESHQDDLTAIDGSETSEEVESSTVVQPGGKASVIYISIETDKEGSKADSKDDEFVLPKLKRNRFQQAATSDDNEDYMEEIERRHNSRLESTSSNRSLKSRESKSLQKEATKLGCNFSSDSWAVRPKRSAKPLEKYQAIHTATRPTIKTGKAIIQASEKPKKGLKRKEPPLVDSLDQTQFNVETNQPRAPKKTKKTIEKFMPRQMEDADAPPDLTSYDSLFDGSISSSKTDDMSDSTNTTTKRRARLASAAKHAKRSNDPHVLTDVSLTVNYAEYCDSLVIREGKSYLPQFKCCQVIPHVQQCRHCVSRQAGDTCRFIGIRAFPIRQQGENMEILTQHGTLVNPDNALIFISEGKSGEIPILPNHFDLNRPMDDVSKMEIMTTAAMALVDILEKGLEHAQQANCIRRARELQIRALCDYCNTGLFSASYMCTRCGCEYCIPCMDTLKSIEERDQVSTQLCLCVRDKAARGTIQGQKANQNTHNASMMIPVTRFSAKELEEEVAAMKITIEKNKSKVATSTMKADSEKTLEVSLKPFDDETPLVIPSQPLTMISKDVLDKEQFLATWSKGEPLVVTDVTTELVWDPNAFVQKYGWMDCEIVRCDSSPPLMTWAGIKSKLKEKPNYFKRWAKHVKVQDFFETFGKADEERIETFGKGIWKLKDWPPAAEFSTSFPDIYKDFNYAVPMPDFTRRDGCVNISSLFPKNANGPDLGPKMYNAWPGEHTRGKKGTTCLHMDVADAVNILLYAAERKGTQPTAQWDIFRAEDANAIRDFLRQKCPKLTGDPIHAQVHYLDDDLLEELYRSKGVHSWRIYQKTGQAVFIPAGCAHQVCNLTDCIKVAVDFISPQNIARCFQLTEEFRGLTLEGKRSWKEDVLQLRAQLWYAWKTCRSLPIAPDLETHQSVVEKRQYKEEKVRETHRSVVEKRQYKEEKAKNLEVEEPERKRPKSHLKRTKQRDPLQVNHEVYVPRGTRSRSKPATALIQEQKDDQGDKPEEAEEIQLESFDLKNEENTLNAKAEEFSPLLISREEDEEDVMEKTLQEEPEQVDLFIERFNDEKDEASFTYTMKERKEKISSSAESVAISQIYHNSSTEQQDYHSAQEEVTIKKDANDDPINTETWCHTPPREDL